MAKRPEELNSNYSIIFFIGDLVVLARETSPDLKFLPSLRHAAALGHSVATETLKSFCCFLLIESFALGELYLQKRVAL